eukprot:TRINITY_DN38210_c0_g1_i1.p2 TRINITY_DN38210_c0_g1~~TRINITY_DN38210_c0_g1_i1.p2  ORF type:complete len:238 (-),score=89.65 TRINITY_DN38210_c0_g1_i1:700-1413(-)
MVVSGSASTDRPGWMLSSGGAKRPGEEAGAAGKAAGKAAKIGQLTGGKVDLEEIIRVLTQLTLANAADVRELCGVTFQTWLVPAECEFAKVMQEAGKIYNDRALELKKEKDKKAEVNMASLGPPYIHMWAAVAEYLASDKSTAAAGPFQEYWELIKKSAKPEDIAEDVRMFRCRKPGKDSRVKDKVKVQFAILNSGLEKAVMACLKAAGGERKVGAAPRGYLEREAKALLDAMTEKK